MIGDVLLIEQKHERVARELAAKVNRRRFDKLTIAIGGESGSGKSEIAETLRNVLRVEGYQVKILHLDNYYKTAPSERAAHRREHGEAAVGLHEIDWSVLNENISAFKNSLPSTLPFLDLYTNQEDRLVTDFKNIGVLIIEGLYACHLDVDINVLIDLTYHDTKKAQIKRNKEKMDSLRFMVLEKEHQEVMRLRTKTDYFVTPNFALIDNTDKFTPLEDDVDGRLLICSRTLPVAATKKRNGEWTLTDRFDGVATAINSIYRAYDSIWFGQCEGTDKCSPGERKKIGHSLSRGRNLHPLFFRNEADAATFNSKSIWPLFHYFGETAEYRSSWWNAYRKYNQEYYRKIAKAIKPHDTLWVHDYQLMLLPAIIRREHPDIAIGFFLHIPFPSFELFRLLPWRKQLLEGLLGADLIGFHTYDYVRHFKSSVFRILGYESKMGNITAAGRMVRIDSFSLGVDFQKYAALQKTPRVEKRLSTLALENESTQVVLSIDRLDYSRGILNKLDVIDAFLANHPEQRGRVTFRMHVVPPFGSNQPLQAHRTAIANRVKECNVRYEQRGWQPITYRCGYIPTHEMVALYGLADVFLVASLRDGMNLMSKEYIAAHNGERGVLMLSEFIGGARELPEAILFNPNDAAGFVAALHRAVTMSDREKTRTFLTMKSRLERATALRWAVDFMEGIKTIRSKQEEARSRNLTGKVQVQLLTDYHTAAQRLFILDYSGTLVPLPKHGHGGPPGQDVLAPLQVLAADKRNTIIIVSANERAKLDIWFKDVRVDLIACSDAAYRHNDTWRELGSLSTDWKDEVRPIIESFADRTPGSSIDEREYSLVWHFGGVDPELGELRSRELIEDVVSFTARDNLLVNEGDQLVEVMNAETHKAGMLREYLDMNSWPFILAAGDDWSNEDMFQLLPAHAYSFKIGTSATNAKYHLNRQGGFVALLRSIAGVGE